MVDDCTSLTTLKKADVFGLRRNFVGDRVQIATISSSTLSVDKKRQLGDECVAQLAGGDSEEAVKQWLQTQLDNLIPLCARVSCEETTISINL